MGNSPIVNRINSLLAEKGIDKKKFYSDCGITSASYSLWNTGKTKPRMKNLEIIADYLNVSVSYLLDGTVKKEKPASNGDEPDKEALLKYIDELDKAELIDVLSRVTKRLQEKE